MAGETFRCPIARYCHRISVGPRRFSVFSSPFATHLSHFGNLCSAAYGLIPAIIRFLRIIRPPDHLPLYCVTPDGFASDPLNIGIIATRRELIMAMERAGWHVADRHSIKNVIRWGLSILLSRPYQTAPVSSMYLFGRKQDIAFEQMVDNMLTSRHHVRFWATTYTQRRPLSIRTIQWQHRRAHVQGDNLLWVGAASLDVGLTLIRHNFQISHMIDPNTNRERELIVEQIQAAGLVRKIDSVRLVKAYRLINRVWNGSLHTDGKMTIVSLRKSDFDVTAN